MTKKMKEAAYIKVILPLRLEWEPCYRLPEGIAPESIAVGDRIKVRFVNKIYSGVVSETGIKPETDPFRIREIEKIEDDLEKILPEEIELWRRVSDYYMCSIGEVYKAAYPVGKINLEEARAAALARVRQKQKRVLDSMRQKVSRIEERLRKKEELIQKVKPGTKTKGRYSEEAEKIRTELAAASQALKDAEAHAAERSETGSAGAYIPKKDILLTDPQQRAYQQILEAFGTGKPAPAPGDCRRNP